jgi:ABC-type Mn2+/Zn2+ transport system permease subunit
LTHRTLRSLLLSLAFGLCITWGGLLISFAGPWRHPPIGFSISALAALVYAVSTIYGRSRRPRHARPIDLDREARMPGGKT